MDFCECMEFLILQKKESENPESEQWIKCIIDKFYLIEKLTLDKVLINKLVSEFDIYLLKLCSRIILRCSY